MESYAGTPLADLEGEVSSLFLEHSARLTSYANVLLGAAGTGQDAVQEVFLRYFAERRYGHRIESPRAWLYRVLHNYAMDQIRTAATKSELPAGPVSPAASHIEGAESRIEQQQTAREIASLLTHREMQCLQLRAHGMSYDEIARTLGVRAGTIGALLPRVYAKLRRAAADGLLLPDHTPGALAMLLERGPAGAP